MLEKYTYKIEKNYIRKKDYKDINFDKLNSVNKTYPKTNASLDEITWQDLNMNKVFGRINHTVTSPGEEKLYSWLKNPIDNKEELKSRTEFINRFKNNKTIVQKIRNNLAKIDYCKFNFKETISDTFLSSNLILVVLILIALTNFSIIAYSIYIKEIFAFPLLIAIMLLNVLIHFRFSSQYGSQLQVLSYVLKLLAFGKKNSKLLMEVAPELAKRLEEINHTLRRITKNGAALFKVEGLDVIADYINVAFLIKEISYLLISKHINKYNDEIIEAYKLIGALDAALSVNCYRESLDYYCEPILKDKEDQIKIIDMYHPLIDHPVSNSVEIDSSVAITGSNMSGKSTFLRTVGLNMLFAQGICTSLSKEYSARFYRLITSISLNDDVLQGKSYFLMEAEAIKRMIELKDDQYPSLILIDEIFKGTNPVERLAASIEILNTLSKANTKTFVATHDLQILPELEGYEYYYFTENVTKDSLEFDYKIYLGITSTRNAIKILEFIKYPEQLVDKINERIEETEV